MNLNNLSVSQISEKIKSKEVTIKEVLDSIFLKIETEEDKINAYVELMKEYAYIRAGLLQEKLDKGEDIGCLGGVPIAVKDNICIKDVKISASSKMLENFISPYDATVAKALEDEGAIIIGRTNMDELGIKGDNKYSPFKKTYNPWDTEKKQIYFNDGSAAAVSADMAFASISSDTGGNIRQSASYTGLVGFKPTYGLVSRYGLIANASSLDQIGPITKNVTDAAIILNSIIFHDKKDTTSANLLKEDYTKYLINDIKDMAFAVPMNFIRDNVDESVKTAFNNSLDILTSLGAKVEEINLDYAKYTLATYNIISTSEISSNFGKYDGIKYGHRTEEFEDLLEIYEKSRTEGFGKDVQQSIILGTYFLSAKHYNEYYKKAQKLRTLIIDEYKKVFEDADILVLPTIPSIENNKDLLAEDIFTAAANIVGMPAVSIPCFVENNIPIGLQFVTSPYEEKKLLQAAYTFEQNTEFHKMKPKI